MIEAVGVVELFKVVELKESQPAAAFVRLKALSKVTPRDDLARRASRRLAGLTGG